VIGLNAAGSGASMIPAEINASISD
jgi:hypothetical protein